MPDFIVQRPSFEHDGEPVAEGATVTLTDEQAAPLLALDAIAPAPAAAPSTKASGKGR